jgi:3-methyladenine DNA glycosylase AlkC
MEPLKEMFNLPFYKVLATAFEHAYPNFNAKGFIKEVTHNIEPLSLNERLRNTSVVLSQHLPADYKQAIDIMFRAINEVPKGYTALVFPDFVGLYGKEHFELSMEALKHFTTFGSSEFAIREFIRIAPEKVLKVMKSWTKDSNPHIRRLASEGSRPRLPWSFKLDAILKNPALTRPILEALKADEELYVKKSVANHLNDLSKDHPDYMIALMQEWGTDNPHTAWIIKHASRSLIKKGHKDSLAIFNFEKKVKLRVENFRLSPARIHLGEVLQLDFDIISEKSTPQKLVIDYAIHYAKATGNLSRKVFKLKEVTLLPGQQLHLTKKQLFKDFTTRKHHSGKHQIEIMINGHAYVEKSFQLIT